MRCVLVTALNICVGGLSPRLIALEIPVLLFFSCAYLHTPVAYMVFLSSVALPNPSHTSLASLLAFPQFEPGGRGGFEGRTDATPRSVSLYDVFEVLT